METREAAYADVVQKAKRLRDSGAISNFSYAPEVITANVRGSTSSYSVELYRQFPGSKAIAFARIECDRLTPRKLSIQLNTV